MRVEKCHPKKVRISVIGNINVSFDIAELNLFYFKLCIRNFQYLTKNLSTHNFLCSYDLS